MAAVALANEDGGDATEATKTQEKRGGVNTGRVCIPGGATVFLSLVDGVFALDATKWRALVRRGGNVAERRKVLTELLSVFPTDSASILLLTELEMSARDSVAIKALFARYLLTSAKVELWMLYLRYIRESQDMESAAGVAALRQAYEYTMEHVGQDFDSGPLWQHYIKFLKTTQPSLLFPDGVGGAPTAQLNARTAAVRKVFQKALMVPTPLLESLWKEYESYENGISKTLAKPLLNDLQPRYLAAKATVAERRKVRVQTRRDIMAMPPPSEDLGDSLRAWGKVVGYEIGNQQRTDEETVRARVRLAFEQGLQALYRSPVWWTSYGRWLEESATVEEAAEVWERSILALPDCLSLQFARAECAECRGKAEEAAAMYEELSERAQHSPPVAVGEESLTLDDCLTLIYVNWMRFARRTQGVKAARQVFSHARKLSKCPWKVFVAAARLEWDVDKEETVSRNVFEFGLKKFMGEPQYILAYATFLSERGDDRNTRALFERALADSNSELVWDAFLQFERERSSLTAVAQLDSRRKKALGYDDGNAFVKKVFDEGHQSLDRYNFYGVQPVPNREFVEHCMEPVEPAAKPARKVVVEDDIDGKRRAAERNETLPPADDDVTPPPVAPVAPAHKEWPHGTKLASDVSDGLTLLKVLPTEVSPVPVPPMVNGLLSKLKALASSIETNAPVPPAALVMALLLASDTSCAAAMAGLVESKAQQHQGGDGAGEKRTKKINAGTVKSAEKRQKVAEEGGDIASSGGQPQGKRKRNAAPGGGVPAAAKAPGRPPVDVFRQRQQQKTKD